MISSILLKDEDKSARSTGFKDGGMRSQERGFRDNKGYESKRRGYDREEEERRSRSRSKPLNITKRYETEDPEGSKIYIGNLPWSVSEE